MNSRANGDERLKQGRRLLREGKFDRAADLFRRMTEDNPDDATAFEGWGTACFSLGKTDEALQAFTRVSQLQPQLARPLINLGAIYNRRGEYQKALDVLRKALQKDRNSADAYYNMGLAHRGLNQLRMAVSAYREAIRLAPEMAEAHLNLANAYAAMKNYRQAISSYRQALALRPGFERARRGLQQAEEALQGRQRTGPVFDQSPGKSAAAMAGRGEPQTLTADDLEQIRRTAPRCEEISRQLSRQLKTDFDHTLRELIKALTSTADAVALEERLEQFRQQVGTILPEFQELDILVRQLQQLSCPGETSPAQPADKGGTETAG